MDGAGVKNRRGGKRAGWNGADITGYSHRVCRHNEPFNICQSRDMLVAWCRQSVERFAVAWEPGALVMPLYRLVRMNVASCA